ncbi:hypothetical protein [Candidatus Enterovibrio altilux]|uniref:Uncharacterized protein n=1 Tax=Candidatus Enterovibrio altilux TaxID=1927128 RepID=A0A291B836_9GAMM|nr:hypothetical protein [Candidatus Enterovibrio luxaltus]ATF09168.1 hypothetical protein BTN50_0646 [Candidatus Enterovibrio luxaltus]
MRKQSLNAYLGISSQNVALLNLMTKNFSINFALGEQWDITKVINIKKYLHVELE